MFGWTPKNENPKVDVAIECVLDEMAQHGPNAQEYNQLLTQLERLYALKEGTSNRRISPDTLVTVAGNLLGILVIVAYEQKHVMTSKGLGFVMKQK